MTPLPCPHCGSTNLIDGYVYIKCGDCLMVGPQMNGGNNNDHADYIDREHAIEAWNSLPRRKKPKEK
jgi:hypothetical protein